MKRRADAVTRLLESWAAWRLGYEFYLGTGHSALVRFKENSHVMVYGSKPLWFGHMHSELSVLHSRFCDELTNDQLSLLVILYGITDSQRHSAMRLMDYERTDRTLRRLNSRARRIAHDYLHPARLYSGSDFDNDSERLRA